MPLPAEGDGWLDDGNIDTAGDLCGPALRQRLTSARTLSSEPAWPAVGAGPATDRGDGPAT